MNPILSTNPDNAKTARASSGKAATLVVATVAVLALGFNVYLASKIGHVEKQADAQRASLEQQVGQLEERLASQQSGHLKTVTELRDSIEKNSRSAYSQARNEAQKRAANVAKEVEDKQRRQQDMFLTEIGGVRDATGQNAEGLATVRGDLAGVAGKVDETSRGLSEAGDLISHTQEELTGVRTRVEEHGDDIQRLRVRTERDRTDFALAKSKDRTKVDDLYIRLKGVNTGKNRYTVEILADDQVIVQKDRYLNEPVELYVAGADRPYEIVVTEIGKDEVKGYLSKPRFMALAKR